MQKVNIKDTKTNTDTLRNGESRPIKGDHDYVVNLAIEYTLRVHGEVLRLLADC